MSTETSSLPIESRFNIYALDRGYQARDGEWLVAISTHCGEDNADGEWEFLPENEWARRVAVSNGSKYVGLVVPLDGLPEPVDRLVVRMQHAMTKAGAPLPEAIAAALREILVRPRLEKTNE